MTTTTNLDSPSLPSLCSILRFSLSTSLTPYDPSPFLHPFTWSEIWHKHCPQKMADVLWKIGHQQIPTGIIVANLVIDGANCPWCPGTVNSIAHLFHDCPTMALIWDQIAQVANLISNSLTPLSDLVHHQSSSHQCISRVLQSVAIHTKWIAYIKWAFSSPTPPLSQLDISNLLLSHILYQCNLDIHTHRSPWSPPSSIINIFK